MTDGTWQYCLNTCFYFLIPTLPLKPSCEEWREQIPRAISAFQEWMVCASLGLWQSELFCHWWWNVAKSLCIPHRSWSCCLASECCLAFEAVVAASPYCFSAWAEHFRCIPITPCTWYHNIHFYSALSSSSLSIKHPYWSYRYVGCFQVEVLFSENSIPLVAVPQDIL